MRQDKLKNSFIMRILERDGEQIISFHNLKTGERLEFESLISAWTFLERQGYIQDKAMLTN